MPQFKRLSSGAGGGFQPSRSGGFRPSVILLLLFSFLAALAFIAARSARNDERKQAMDVPNKKVLDWREQLALESLKSVLTKEVIDSISASKNDLGTWSLDLFRRNHVPSSWIIEGSSNDTSRTSSYAEQKTSLTKSEKNAAAGDFKKTDGKRDNTDGHQLVDTQAKQARRQLRERRREKRAMELVEKDGRGSINPT